MTDLEIMCACAEAMGYRTFKEKRGEFTLCVAVAPGAPMPWERKRTPDPQRYQEVSISEAMKIGFFGTGIPNPLHDDAQAMALVKRFMLWITPSSCSEGILWGCSVRGARSPNSIVNALDLNRAICECVAKMQLAKRTDSASSGQEGK